MNAPRKLTRYDYNWVPDVDDDNDYVWRHGAWEVDNLDDEDEELWNDCDLEEYEENKRRKIAERNEY